uniref:26S proteasome regulatory subunit 7 n=2 Tax=Globodera TaxID=31242 RepID=A0A914H3L4_GLORO
MSNDHTEKKVTTPTDANEKTKELKALNEEEIAALNTYNVGPYTEQLKKAEKDIEELQKRINTISGVTENDTGLTQPASWDLVADAIAEKSSPPLLVARCVKIIKDDQKVDEQKTEDDKEKKDARYMIAVRHYARFVVGLHDDVAPTDIEEGMRVGVDRIKYQIRLPLPAKIDATVMLMEVDDKPDVTYADIGGCEEQIKKLREVVEFPLLQPERYTSLGIEPPKGVMFFGPPGTGKTLCARAVANRTDATFIRIIGSELVKKYVGEGARMVRELFLLAKSKKACIMFFDEVDAIGGARFNDGKGGDNEVQRTMLELVNQLDGFDARGTIKVLMATNRPDTLDPALVRPGRIDRRIEFSLPDQKSRSAILRIHTKKMSVDRNIRYELIARLCPNSTGADLRSVCTEAGMFALRARRRFITEQDFLNAVQKVVKGYAKFSSTPAYMTHN